MNPLNTLDACETIAQIVNVDPNIPVQYVLRLLRYPRTKQYGVLASLGPYEETVFFDDVDSAFEWYLARRAEVLP